MFVYIKRSITLLIFLTSFGLFNTLFAQKKCGTDEFNSILQKKLKWPESESTFENWIKVKSQSTNSKSTLSNQQAATIYTIPVVFHVIHNGEALNEGGNVSDEIILGQLDSLNKDFRRLNADTVDTPLAFQPIAADISIEFVLAKRDPEGLPTTGIVRKQGTQTNYSINDPLTLTQQSYWPAEDYMNIWITDVSSGFLGFAQFPTSNLEGLDSDQSISRLTDGVVLDWKFTGTNYDTGNFASLGRTGTHEIGHFLGLKHIWGSSGCGSDDYCNDTPTQNNSSSGCPSVGSLNSCGTEDMFQNFMDYTDDVCMNLFTECQSNRMRIIMENSPRRKSLLSSKGGIDPVFVANDLGIKEIISPLNSTCSNELIPQIELRNYGSNRITDFIVELYINDVLSENLTKQVNLDYLDTDIISFNTITENLNETVELKFQITSVNLTSDANPENNQKTVQVIIPIESIIPSFEDFENGLSDWLILNSNFDNSAIVIQNAPNISSDNRSISFNYFNSDPDKFGEKDWLISPQYDLSALPTADLNFKYAYAPVNNNATDVLTIAVSIDCGNTFDESDYIYQRFSPSLGTTNTTTQSFTPNGPSDWVDVNLNLTDYAGMSNVVLAFIGHNGNGNNLFIDDIEVTSNNILAYNIGIVNINSLPYSTCSNNIFPTVEIKNFGFETITDFELEYSINGQQNTISTQGTSILPGKTKSVLLPIKNLTNGSYEISFNATKPNGRADEQTSNNLAIRNLIVRDASDDIPLIEVFDSNINELNWDVASTNPSSNLSTTISRGNGNNNYALFLNSFNIPELGAEYWFISPQLDLTHLDSASMIFKVSYANAIGRSDQLEVLVSKNCGISYDEVIYSKKGSSLAVTESNVEWFPETNEDWITEFIDLSEFTDFPNLKVAFVFTNQNGNNIFLDDIEFFNEGSPSFFNSDEVLLRIYPNPAKDYFNIKFDLDLRDDITLSLINMTGSIVYQNEIPNMLNQEYTVNTNLLKNGIYLLYAKGPKTNLSKRVLIEN